MDSADIGNKTDLTSILDAIRTEVLRLIRSRGPRPSVKVRRRYWRAYVRMRAEGKAPNDFTGSRSNYHFKRAAWTWGITRELSSLVRSLGKGTAVDTSHLKDVTKRTIQLKAELREYPPDPERDRVNDEQYVGEFARLVKNPPRPRSGRQALRGLPNDWRERVVMKACVVGSEYALPLAVQSVTGCRAAELELGVKVRWQQGQLEFEIRGAKYVEGRQGQEWRKIVVPVEGVDTQIVQEALRRQGEPVMVQVHAAKGLSWAASYFGRKALGTRVTGHMFRHQLAADLKAEGFDSFDLAAALGQLTTKTGGIYGRPRDAKGTKRRMTAKAASAVRDTATYKSEGPRRQHDPVVKRP